MGFKNDGARCIISLGWSTAVAYTFQGESRRCAERKMGPVISADTLAAQLEMAELLRAGRDRMLDPQDLPGRYGRVVRRSTAFCRRSRGRPWWLVDGQSGGTVMWDVSLRIWTLSYRSIISMRCCYPLPSAALKFPGWLPASGPNSTTRRRVWMWTFFQRTLCPARRRTPLPHGFPILRDWGPKRDA